MFNFKHNQKLKPVKMLWGLFKKVPYSVVPSDNEASTGRLLALRLVATKIGSDSEASMSHFVLPRVARHP